MLLQYPLSPSLHILGHIFCLDILALYGQGGALVPPDVLTQGYGGDDEGQDEEEGEEGDGEDVVC